MGRQHGRFAQVYMDITGTGSAAALPNTMKYNVSFGAKNDPVTSFGDTNEIFVQGLPSGTGSFDGFWDSGTHQAYTASVDGVARKTYFYPATPATAGPYWYGTWFWSMDVEVDVGSAVKVKGTFSPASNFVKIGS